MAQQVSVTYYPTAKVKCLNCESEYTLGLTQEYIEVEVCGNCHPFYTGQDTVLDTAGRIEKFQERLKKSQSMQEKKKKVKSRKIRQTLADLDSGDTVNEDKPKVEKTTKTIPSKEEVNAQMQERGEVQAEQA